MSSLAQVATVLPHGLNEVAEAAAREVGFIRRQRVLSGAGFVQALVLGWLGSQRRPCTNCPKRWR